MGGGGPTSPFEFEEEAGLSSDDITKWAPGANKEIQIGAKIQINRDDDRSLYDFFIDYFKITTDNPSLIAEVASKSTGKSPPEVEVVISGTSYTDEKAQEFLKRLRVSGAVLFHSSTNNNIPTPFGMRGIFREISNEKVERLEKSKSALNRAFKKIARQRESELANLLGKMQENYRVEFSIPTLDFSFVPYKLMLCDSKIDIQLEDWGSGTQNRTIDSCDHRLTTM